MTTATTDEILAKVQRLFALAHGSANRHEAEAAARKANEILQRHRLSFADVEAADPRCAEPIGTSAEPLDRVGGRKIAWRSRLAHVLCDHYACMIWWQVTRGETLRRRPGKRRRHRVERQEAADSRVAGRTSDVAMVRLMFAWLSAEVVRLSMAEVPRSRQSFCQGCVSGITTALAASTVQTRQEHRGEGAIVLASRVDAVRTWVEERLDLVKRRPSASVVDPDAYGRGDAAGQAIDVHGRVLPRPRALLTAGATATEASHG